jgi:hypothetical protein
MGADAENLPGAKPVPFFAPGRMAKRTRDWGAAGLAERVGGAWTKFCDASDAWLRVVHSHGREGLESVYAETHAGRASPADGYVVSLRERT